jgi:GR25 family glycosyltransferase involved in LPS biosynthesis
LKAFLITAAHEINRSKQVESLVASLPCVTERIEAIYPSRKRLPFQDALLAKSKERTGKSLLLGELGCLMSHRLVWRKIMLEAENDNQHYLILESDSHLVNPNLLAASFKELTANKDMFFWGAWEGHMKFFQSSKKKYSSSHVVGEPFIKTAYCTYGYSVNKIAAALLLQRTAKISYPVDQFKRFFGQKEIRLGGVYPEIITGNHGGSTIRNKESVLRKKLFLFLLDLKNNLICSLR